MTPPPQLWSALAARPQISPPSALGTAWATILHPPWFAADPPSQGWLPAPSANQEVPWSALSAAASFLVVLSPVFLVVPSPILREGGSCAFLWRSLPTLWFCVGLNDVMGSTWVAQTQLLRDCSLTLPVSGLSWPGWSSCQLYVAGFSWRVLSLQVQSESCCCVLQLALYPVLFVSTLKCSICTCADGSGYLRGRLSPLCIVCKFPCYLEFTELYTIAWVGPPSSHWL